MPTELERRFDDPPRSFSPVPIWWWSGELLEPERLRWQLDPSMNWGESVAIRVGVLLV
jgi:hypothetical protein